LVGLGVRVGATRFVEIAELESFNPRFGGVGG